MSIKRTIITTIVALAVVAMVAPGVAQGVTIDELLAQIALLQTQLLALQGGGSTGSGTAPAVCAGVTFSRNLTVGSTGSDVKCLQALLNKSATTQVSTTGAGSPGSETTYFGAKTLAAVKIYQTQQGFTPANQVGPLTRARLNAALAGGTTGGTTPVVIVPTGAGLTVQLAFDNPASGTLVSGSTATDAQGGADIAHLTFVNGDNAEVKVTALNLKRIGVSDDALLNAVYLYDGANRLTDGASVSTQIINFNDPAGLFTVPAGGSKTIRVLADTVYNKSGQTVGVQIVAATSVTTNASSVKGTFPVSSNLMTTASATLATVAFAISTTPSAAAGTADPQDAYTVWQNIPSFGTRAVTLKRFALRQTGSVLPADIQNYRLYIDGVQAGSAVAQVDANGYITFDLSASPVRIETGARTIKVLADIIGGSSKTFIYSLRQTTDAAFTDTQVGVDLVPTGNSTSTTGAFAQRITGTTTINSGTVTFTKTTDSPSGNIVLSAPNAVIAKFTLKAAGEPVKISDLYVAVTDSTAGVANFRNGALYANGVQVGSTMTLVEIGDLAAGNHFSLGSSLIVNPGSPVTLEVRSDIKESTGTAVAANQTVYATIIAGSSNAEGRVSKTTISTPSAAVTGNTLTVKTGTLTLSKYTAYTNQSMVPPLTAAKLAHFTVTAATSEAVNITSIEANLNPTVSSYVTNLYVKFGDQTTTVKPTVSAASNSWSVNYTIAAGATKDLIVYGDINSSAGGTGIISAYVSGTTGSSATSATAGTTGAYTEGTTGVQGQSIAFTTGSFTPAVDGTTPLAAIVAGGQLVAAGKFKFTAQYDNYTINELRFTVAANSNAANNSAAIVSAVVKDGDTVLATVPYDSTNSYFNVTGLTVPVATNTTKVLTLAFDLSTGISSTSSTSQVDVQPVLDYVKYSNSQGTQATIGTGETTNTTYATSKEAYVFKSIPTVTKVATTSPGNLTNQTFDLYSWKVAADTKGAVTVKQVKFDTTWRDGGTDSTLQLYAFKLYKDGNDITSLVTITDEDGNALEGTVAADGADENTTKIIIDWATEDTISAGGSATYLLRATASGFAAKENITNDDGVTLNLASDTAVNGSTLKYLTNITTGDYVQLCTSAEGTNTDYNFIWSDNSASDHDSTESEDNNGTASTSGDWANGYLVKDLPLSSATFLGP